MNPALSTVEADALLELLYRGLVSIREAGMSGDAERAAAIADALHNVPHLIARGGRCGSTVAGLRELFVAPLVECYPDLAWLTLPLDDLNAPG